jgi:DNA-binding FadR family transcriptional regulator
VDIDAEAAAVVASTFLTPIRLAQASRTGKETAVERTATALRRLILASPDGAYIGSEDQLREQLAVSRPTMRQAIRLLQHEHLLVSKRGGAGGLYGRRPEVEAVVQAAATYLAIEAATTRHFFACSVTIVREALRLACQSDDEEQRGRLRKLLERTTVGAESSPLSRRDQWLADRDLGAILGGICGNPVLKLFISIVYRFGWVQWSERLLEQHDEQLRVLWRVRDSIIEAILARDIEKALALGQQRADLIFQLLDEIDAES